MDLLCIQSRSPNLNDFLQRPDMISDRKAFNQKSDIIDDSVCF